MDDTEESSNSEAEGHFKKWSRNALGEYVPVGGIFTDEESATVKAAATLYCSKHQITLSSLCSEYDLRKYHKGAWVEIAKKLPHRSVVSVYRHGIRIMHPFKRGEWTNEEENALIECVIKYGKKYSTIQKKLNRSADACRDKYRELSAEYVNGKWDNDDWEKLLRLVREHLHVAKDMSFEDLVRRIHEQKIVLPWDSLSKKMVNRSRLSCLRKWKGKVKKYTSIPESDSDSSSSQPKKPPKQKKRRKTDEVGKSTKSSNKDKPRKSSKKSHKSSIGIKHASTNASVDSYDSSESSSMDIVVELWSYDKILLERLVSSAYKQMGSVPWATIHHPLGNAMERWNILCDEFYALIDDPNLEDEFSDKPLWEKAQLILNKKRMTIQGARGNVAVKSYDDDEDEKHARQAACTVEALGLPSL